MLVERVIQDEMDAIEAVIKIESEFEE